MIGYTEREVASVLGLPEARIRAFVKEGFLEPRRGQGGELRFGFQDLVLLRTAKGLTEAGVSPRRVRRALASLEAQLPRGRPLTAVQVFAREGDVVVHDGDLEWEPVTGQVLFNFDVKDLASEAEPLTIQAERRATEADLEMSADDWYELGSDLETVSPARARDAYRRALELEPRHVEARINAGRLLYEAGLFEAAEAHFAYARRERASDATAAFNHGLAFEALARPRDAVEAYRAAVEQAPRYREAYRALARLYERMGEAQAALQTYARYKELFGE